MSIEPDEMDKSAQTASDAGAFVEKASGAAQSSNSMLGRVGAAVTAVQLGTRLLPAGWRLLRRYPVVSGVAIVGLACVMYLTRPTRMSMR